MLNALLKTFQQLHCQNQTCNKPVNAQQLKLLGPPLRWLFCALIAQNNQLRSGPLPERCTAV